MMINVVIGQAIVAEVVRANADLQELAGMMPLSDEAKDAIWNVLCVSYTLGLIAGIDAAAEKVPA